MQGAMHHPSSYLHLCPSYLWFWCGAVCSRRGFGRGFCSGLRPKPAKPPESRALASTGFMVKAASR